MTFYSINNDNLFEPVREWEATFTDKDFFGKLFYIIRSKNDTVHLCGPYKQAYGWLYYDSAEEAENARRMAILARFGEAKKERYRIYREMRKLQEEINSWSEVEE